MEYRATRWSGPADLPDLGRFMSSGTARRERLWGSDGSLWPMTALKRLTELERTSGLLDLELLMIWPRRLWSESTARGGLYAKKKRATARGNIICMDSIIRQTRTYEEESIREI